MSGASWDDRKEGDWLASNGRWFPARDYPKGWHMTALPPAPGHQRRSGIDLVNDRADRLRELASRATATGAPGRTAAPPATPQHAPSTSTQPRTSGPAEATITSQRNHMTRVESGPPPPRQIAGAAPKPPPPGRVRDDAPDMPSPPSPPTTRPPARAPDTHDAVANEFGRVISKTKRQIRDAINESGKGTTKNR